MQIELVGCTGAGKSTLAARLAGAARREGIDLILGDEFALNQLRLRRVRARWLRALAVHAVASWGCVTNGRRHARFVCLAYRALRDAGIPRRQQCNQLRKVLKQLGRYEVIRRSRPNQTAVLVDEGTLHSAHNLFVHVDCELNDDQLGQFAELVPLPDVVIYVREREDALVERTLSRGHPRIPDGTPRSVASFVRRAVLAFDQLTSHERIAPRTLVVQEGMIVSEPIELSKPRMRPVLELLRRVIQPASSRTKNLPNDSAAAVHSGAA